LGRCDIAPKYAQIYQVIRKIPPGKVATYGQIAGLVGTCTARMVGYALAALSDQPRDADVPWQRVINAQGKISPHGFGMGSAVQRQLLEDEGVEFDANGRVDFEKCGWLGEPQG
jgi:methylated-DNA-protein-cysteine methyltransferase related protein